MFTPELVERVRKEISKNFIVKDSVLYEDIANVLTFVKHKKSVDKIKWLQYSTGEYPDGIIGKNTFQSISQYYEKCIPDTLYCDQQIHETFYHRMIEQYEKRNWEYSLENDEVNLAAIENIDQTRPKGFFNDMFVLWGNFNLTKKVYCFRMTTTPGLYYTNNPMHKNGAAHLEKEKQFKAWQIGKHQGLYRALVQSGGTVNVFRDVNKNLDVDSEDVKDTGYFGINIHRANVKTEPHHINVEKFSAGCQVIQMKDRFDILMEHCLNDPRYLKNGSFKFSYGIMKEII